MDVRLTRGEVYFSPRWWDDRDDLELQVLESIEIGDSEMIPEVASLNKEENGVKWYVEEDERGRTINNYMEIDGQQVLMGAWAGPRMIFYALISMSSEERGKLASLDHDECMFAIRMKLAVA